MITITISIDIENPAEVAASQGGIFSGPIGLLPKSLIKSKVEDKVKSEVVNTLNSEIRSKFDELGIKASIDIK